MVELAESQGFELCRAPEMIDSAKAALQLVPTREIQAHQNPPISFGINDLRDLLVNRQLLGQNLLDVGRERERTASPKPRSGRPRRSACRSTL
jgi:hypothetical protein